MHLYRTYQLTGEVVGESNDYLIVRLDKNDSVYYNDPDAIESAVDEVVTAITKGPVWNSKYVEFSGVRHDLLVMRKVKDVKESRIPTSAPIKSITGAIHDFYEANGYDYRIAALKRDLQDSVLKPYISGSECKIKECVSTGVVKEHNSETVDANLTAKIHCGFTPDDRYYYGDTDQTYKVERQGKNIGFSLENSNDQIKSISFVSPWDIVKVPFDGNREKLKSFVRQIIERREKAPTGFDYYHVVACSVECGEPHSVIKTLPNMTTESMLAFFGTSQRRGSKIETLTECLTHLSRKAKQNAHEFSQYHGKKFYIVISSGHNPAIKTKDILPVDATLSLATHLKVLSSTQFKSGFAILAEVVEKYSDDFVNYLYGIMEDKSRSDTCIYAFDEKAQEKLIASV